MQQITVGQLVFEEQSDGNYLCLGADFVIEVKLEPHKGWHLTLSNSSGGYTEAIYDVSAEGLRVTLRLICRRASLDADGLLRTARVIWGSLG